MAFIYILECNDSRYYVGSTINIQQRLKDHFGRKCRFTKSRLPIRLVRVEEYSTIFKARKRELEIKGHKSRKYIEKLIKFG